MKGRFRAGLRYLRSPRVAWWRKLLGLFALLYVIAPVDLLPDVVPVLGWLDDLGVVTAVGAFLLRDLKRFEREDAAPGRPP